MELLTTVAGGVCDSEVRRKRGRKKNKGADGVRGGGGRQRGCMEITMAWFHIHGHRLCE